jgi:hypothetical protein
VPDDVRRPCPHCTRELVLAAGIILYPREEREWRARTLAVCWACGVFRRRGEPWRKIDQRKHQRQWQRYHAETLEKET